MAGSGSIRKLGEGRWYLRITLGYTVDPDTGKRSRKTFSRVVKGTKRMAQEELTRLLRERDTGTSLTPGKMTVSAFLDHWLQAAAAARVKPQTARSYGQVLDLYIRPALGEQRLGQLSAVAIQKAYGDLLARGLSGRTIEYAHRVLSRALKQGERWGFIARNPCGLVDVPKPKADTRSSAGQPKVRAMDREQVVAFLAAAEGEEPWHALFELAFASGLRPGELLGLRWSALELGGAPRLRVEQALVGGDRGTQDKPRFDTPKTARSRRTVDLPSSVKPVLRRHRASQNRERLVAGTAYAEGFDLVFADPIGRPLRTDTMRSVFARVAKKAGLPTGFTPYSTRHTFATLLLQANVPVKIVSEALGHASIALTLDVYSHVLPGMGQQTAAAMDRILGGR